MPNNLLRSLIAGLAALTLLLQPTVAQQVVPPPPPVNDPGDPPLLLPGLGGQPPIQNPSTPMPNGPSIVDPPIVDATPGADPMPNVGDPPEQVALVRSVLQRPELVIDAGGFLSPVGAVTISPDNRTIAACGGKLVYLLDAESGQPITVLRGQQLRTSLGNANCAAFSPDGQFLLIGVHDDRAHGSIRVYRTNNYSQIDSLLPGLNSPCAQLTFSADGRWLAAADANGKLHLWDWASQQIVKEIPPPDASRPIVDHLQFVSGQAQLLAIYDDGPHLYQCPDGRELNAQDGIPPKVLSWMYALLQDQVEWPATMDKVPRTYDLPFDKGSWLAAGIGKRFGRSAPWVGIWTASTRLTPAGQKVPPARQVYRGHKWDITCVASSPDGRFAVSGDKFGEVHIWDTATATTRHRFTAQGRPVYQAAFTPGGDRIVFGLKADIEGWTFNNYGLVTHELNLDEQTIRPLASAQVIDEMPSWNGVTVSARPGTTADPNGRVTLTGRGLSSEYKMPTGRIPACYSLTTAPALGIDQPVLYADNLGFVAAWDPSGTELRRAYRGHNSMVTSISVASNNKLFVTGSTDRTLRIWSLLNHKPTGIFDFRYENSVVVEVYEGSESWRKGVQAGDRVVALDGLSLDQVYRMMLYGQFPYRPGQQVPVTLERNGQRRQVQLSLVEGFDYVEPLMSVYVGDRNEWIMWTPQGYYDCSPGADNLIGWHVNNGPDQAAEFYRVQQFRRKFYRPDIIREVLKTGDFEIAAENAAEAQPRKSAELDLQDPQDFARTAPPSVTITSPQAGDAEDDRIFVEAVVKAPNDLPITEVTLLHNGTPAKVFRPRDPEQQKSFEISHRLKLFAGDNRLTFIAANASATSSAESATVVVKSSATKQKRKVWVLAIGISEYETPSVELKNLQFATNDAKAFAASVEEHASGQLYDDVQTKLLLNEGAGRADILDGLQWLVDNVKAGDAVMLFSSAHGFLDDREQFYLGTHEVQPDRLRATAVSWREVIGILHEELPACQRLVFLDSCHAEGIRPMNASEALHDLAAPEMGTVFYASCTMKQKSFERDEWKHGAFTRAILDILSDRSADVFPKTGDGLLSHAELELSVVDRVSTMTGNRQNPVVYAPMPLRKNNVFEVK